MPTKPTRQSVARRRERLNKQLEDMHKKERELALLQAELEADACLKIIKEYGISVEEMITYVKTRQKENKAIINTPMEEIKHEN